MRKQISVKEAMQRLSRGAGVSFRLKSEDTWFTEFGEQLGFNRNGDTTYSISRIEWLNKDPYYPVVRIFARNPVHSPSLKRSSTLLWVDEIELFADDDDCWSLFLT